VNKDGLDDIYICGAKGPAGSFVYIKLKAKLYQKPMKLVAEKDAAVKTRCFVL
jgi:hypothetical protein